MHPHKSTHIAPELPDKNFKAVKRTEDVKQHFVSSPKQEQKKVVHIHRR